MIIMHIHDDWQFVSNVWRTIHQISPHTQEKKKRVKYKWKPFYGFILFHISPVLCVFHVCLCVCECTSVRMWPDKFSKTIRHTHTHTQPTITHSTWITDMSFFHCKPKAILSVCPYLHIFTEPFLTILCVLRAVFFSFPLLSLFACWRLCSFPSLRRIYHNSMPHNPNFRMD